MARRRNRGRGGSRNTDPGNVNSYAKPRIYRQPRIMGMGGDKITIRGKEQLGTFGTKASFACYAFLLDPTNPLLVWLTRMAKCYNRYVFRVARFSYEPFCPTSTAGRLMLSYSSDPNDSVPATSNAQFQYARSCSAPVWAEQSITATPSRRNDYTVGDTGDDIDNTQGKFFYGLDAGPATDVGAGAIFLDYVIELWDRASYAGNL